MLIDDIMAMVYLGETLILTWKRSGLLQMTVLGIRYGSWGIDRYGSKPTQARSGLYNNQVRYGMDIVPSGLVVPLPQLSLTLAVQ